MDFLLIAKFLASAIIFASPSILVEVDTYYKVDLNQFSESWWPKQTRETKDRAEE